VATTVQASIDFSNFLAHLYQRHGSLYNEDGSRTFLDSETAIEAFDVYTKFFTHCKMSADGTIDRSALTGTLASMIFYNAKNPDLVWMFLKWRVSADTQLRFGWELESSVMDAAARYPTANYDAFTRLSWGSEEMAVLREQRSLTVGTLDAPGGYYVSRHITNVVRRVIDESEDTRETLLDYSMT
jgi:ABC-type glycerol-3-phosphate transport system substrate-binding protein